MHAAREDIFVPVALAPLLAAVDARDPAAGARPGAGLMTALAVGIDVGTSGVRAAAMDAGFAVAAEAATPMAAHGPDPRDPAVWARAADAALADLLARIDPRRVRALAVDGTSGTLLPVDRAGHPLARPLMYDDTVADAGRAGAHRRRGAGRQRRARGDLGPRQGDPLPGDPRRGAACCTRPTGSPAASPAASTSATPTTR